jgi:DNA polymerase III gamma/tau subunit
MSLITKYRPQTFNDVLGNKSVVTALKKMVKREKKDIPNAFLFHGPSGCGKTTIARILAKELGSTNRGVMEINASDYRGVDTIRDISSTLLLRPIVDGTTTYILDESHMLTKEAQNALLKLIEDSPEHAFFCFCTTEPDKLIKTVVNRCSVFAVKPLEDDDMLKLVEHVVKEETKRKEINFSQKAIEKIADSAEGCPRTALSNLDKVLWLDDIKLEEFLETIETYDSSIKKLCQCILNHKPWYVVKEVLRGIKEEPETIRYSILGYMEKVLMNSKGDSTGRAATIIDVFSDNFYDSKRAGLVMRTYELCQ